MNKVLNDNTISATLATKYLSDAAFSTMQGPLAPLNNAASTNLTTDPVKPNAVIEVPIVTATPVTKTNATSWETAGDTTVSNVEVTPNLYSQSFHISNFDLQTGSKVVTIMRSNAMTFAYKLIDVAFAPLTTAIFGAATFTGLPESFNLSDVATLLAAIKTGTKRTLVLDTEYYARLLPGLVAGGTFTIPGFNGGVFENARWDGAGANVRGFASSPECLGIGSGLPLDPPNTGGEGLITTGKVTIPGINLTVAFSSWQEPRYRRTWFSYDVMLGAKEANTSALKLIKSAA